MSKPQTRFEMKDGSVFQFPHPYWEQAFLMKHPDISDEIKERFAVLVKEYWDAKKTRDKFGDKAWEKEYKTQAELAEDLMYCEVRAPLMVIVISQLSGGKSSVLALGKDGPTKYTGGEPKKTTIEEELGEDKK